MTDGRERQTGWKKHEGDLQDLLEKYPFQILQKLNKFPWINECEIFSLPAGSVFLSPEAYGGEVYLVLDGFVSLGRRVEREGVHYLIQDGLAGANSVVPAAVGLLECQKEWLHARRPEFYAWGTSKALARLLVLSEERIKIKVPDRFKTKIVGVLQRYITITTDQEKYGLGKIVVNGREYSNEPGKTIFLPPEYEIFSSGAETIVLKIPAKHLTNLSDELEWLMLCRDSLGSQIGLPKRCGEYDAAERLAGVYYLGARHGLVTKSNRLVLLGGQRLTMMLYEKLTNDGVDLSRLKRGLQKEHMVLSSGGREDLLEDEELLGMYDFLHCRRGHKKGILILEKLGSQEDERRD